MSGGDVVAFYAGLRPVIRCEHHLVYALLGFYRIHQVIRAGELRPGQWATNAHTRCEAIEASDVSRRTRADHQLCYGADALSRSDPSPDSG